jgi:outer membrane receptor protein involved in Fe transport
VLTLINGRRAIPYALTNSASGTPQTVFNFNSIPASAIQSVEYLKDGASAIYGSDAITGVFNMILKKNYEGSSIDVTFANTLKHDTLRKTVSIFTGLSKEGWEITGGVTLQSRHASFLKDYGITTTDYRYLGQKGINQNSTIYHPSYLNLTAAQAVASGLGTTNGFYIVQGPTGTANPTKASFTYVGTSTAVFTNDNRQDFANVTQLYPSSESGGAYASILRTINPHVTAFANVLYSRSLTHYELQPYGFTNSLAGITLPATNPYNPTGLSLTNTATSFPYLFRGRTLPKREVASTTLSTVAGLRGTALRIWNWETGVSYAQNGTTRDTDLIAAADLQAALNGTTRATAWNPFGPSDNPDVEKNLYTLGDRPAIIWEPNEPQEQGRTLTYRELFVEVCRFANALLAKGIGKGDRVIIYMPMVPEAAIAMLACARIGAIHSVVFAGFSSSSLADRIQDCQAKAILTSDGNYGGNKKISIKIIN